MTTRSRNDRNSNLNYLVTTSTSTNDQNTTLATIASPPEIYDNELPISLPREFTETEGRKRSENQLPTSENLNFISRGRLMVLNRLKALHLHVPDKICRKTCNLLNNDIQQI